MLGKLCGINSLDYSRIGAAADAARSARPKAKECRHKIKKEASIIY
jgi:hypothetical protein